ncbi:dipicolinate synthase subunit B [Tissierella creatinophila]|uniref:Dipicolinate synthase subunit B n=1 Tax=Tissierella creatinophila DSM 6911 TaxID=1123403 RepID=A0A1U7M7F4_TISCR|nr:dipicolinate synthase subunit B [Tissierella creatinophila]OLS03264.1 dipicolinate synthase subunit B [Tissierella creatinophila DSM 6911]
MKLEGIKIGIAITGSFCSFEKAYKGMESLVKEGADIYPMMSAIAYKTDTKFGLSKEWNEKFEKLTGKEILNTIEGVEPIGPTGYLDIIVVAPCTGNTIAKMANGITDTSVTMACKAHLRNEKPVVVAMSTNDGLGATAKNLATLLNKKNVYFVPFKQDDPAKKPNSLACDFELIKDTVIMALEGKQIQPVIL